MWCSGEPKYSIRFFSILCWINESVCPLKILIEDLSVLSTVEEAKMKTQRPCHQETCFLNGKADENKMQWPIKSNNRREDVPKQCITDEVSTKI